MLRVNVKGGTGAGVRILKDERRCPCGGLLLKNRTAGTVECIRRCGRVTDAA